MRGNPNYFTARRKRRTDRAKQMAARRWEIDRERRARLAEVDPVKFSGRIVRRIVVITNETTVKEAVIYDWDSYREAKRKLNSALTNISEMSAQ